MFKGNYHFKFLAKKMGSSKFRSTINLSHTLICEHEGFYHLPRFTIVYEQNAHLSKSASNLLLLFSN